MLLDWVLTYMLHSSLFLGAALVMRLVLRERRLALQEIVLRAALFGGFATAGLQVGFGVRPVLGIMQIEEASKRSDAGSMRQPVVSLDAVEARELVGAQESMLWTRPESPDTAGGTLKTSPTLLTPLPSEPSEDPLERFVVASGGTHSELSKGEEDSASVAAAGSSEPAVTRGQDSSEVHSALSDAAPGQVAQRSPLNNDWVAVVGRILGAAWAALLLAGLLRMALSAASLRRLLFDRQPMNDDGLQETFDALSVRLGLAGAPSLTVSRRLTTPIARGVIKPEVCVPERVVHTLPPLEQEALCAHELAHHARRDPLWLIVTQVAVAVGALQPMNVWARRRLSDLAECLSDDLAVEVSSSSVGLARSLVNVASWTVGRKSQLSAATAGALRSTSRLALRVERIMNPDRVPSASRGLVIVVAIATVAAVAVLVPGVSGGASAIPASLDAPTVAFLPSPESPNVATLDPPKPELPDVPAASDAPSLPPDVPETPEPTEARSPRAPSAATKPRTAPVVASASKGQGAALVPAAPADVSRAAHAPTSPVAVSGPTPMPAPAPAPKASPAASASVAVVPTPARFASSTAAPKAPGTPKVAKSPTAAVLPVAVPAPTAVAGAASAPRAPIPPTVVSAPAPPRAVTPRSAPKGPAAPPAPEVEDAEDAFVESAPAPATEVLRAKGHELGRQIEALRAELEAKTEELAESRAREEERLAGQAAMPSPADARRLAEVARRAAMVNAQDLERLARKNAALSRADARRLAEEVRRSTEDAHRLAEVDAQELERLANETVALSGADARRLAEEGRRLAMENQNDVAEAAVMAQAARKMAADALRQSRTAKHDALRAGKAIRTEDRRPISEVSPTVSGLPVGVGIFTSGGLRGLLEPKTEPYFSDGASVSVFLLGKQALSDNQDVKTADGKVVTGFKFIGWHEGQGTRVMAFVLIPREGVDNTYLPDGDAKNLMPREFSTHLVGPTGEVPVSKMRELGLEPMVLRQVPLPRE